MIPTEKEKARLYMQESHYKHHHLSDDVFVPHLEDWLTLLDETPEDYWYETLSGRLHYWISGRRLMSFDLSTGQPWKEEDYEMLNKIISKTHLTNT